VVAAVPAAVLTRVLRMVVLFARIRIWPVMSSPSMVVPSFVTVMVLDGFSLLFHSAVTPVFVGPGLTAV
jgi:hypothetical protein